MLDTKKLQLFISANMTTDGLIIHTPTKDNYNDLMVALDTLGYRWGGTSPCVHVDIYRYDEGGTCIRLISSRKKISYASKDFYVNTRGLKVWEFQEIEKTNNEGENKMMNNNVPLKEWMYIKDAIGMTNLAQYIYKAFAKKFAKAYKETYKTEQSEKDIETVVYLAFRNAHERSAYYRTPAKNVVMNRQPLDLNKWMQDLQLSSCFISNDLEFTFYMTRVNADGLIRYVSSNHLSEFNELYFKCDTCNCYHEKAKTSNVKVYDHIEDEVKVTCSKKVVMGNFKLINGVYYDKALITNDGSIAKPYIYSYHSYNWRSPKAQAKSVGADDNSLKMGIEIETYGSTNNSALVNKYDDYFHCEYDGSLASGNSFEMISVPMTKNYWDSIRNTIIEPLFKTLRDNKQTEGNNGYGLHVHIDSKAFKDIDSVKWFIHNVQLHQRLIQKVARRASNHYYDYHTSNGMYAIEELNISKLSQDFSSHGTCVNTHMCGDSVGRTVEIRVFKSTLDSETLYSTLKLVENLVRLANEHSTSRRELLRGLKDYAIKQRIVIE